MFFSCGYALRFIKEKDVYDQKRAADADTDIRDVKDRPDTKVEHIRHLAQRHAIDQIAEASRDDELQGKAQRKMRVLMSFHVP